MVEIGEASILGDRRGCHYIGVAMGESGLYYHLQFLASTYYNYNFLKHYFTTNIVAIIKTSLIFRYLPKRKRSPNVTVPFPAK